MDLLLDVNIVLDLCVPRLDHYDESLKAVQQCVEKSGTLWLYTGSVQTMIYNLQREIRRDNPTWTQRASMKIALQRLDQFAKDKQWLASLSGEGAVFNAMDPEDEQLVRAMERFPEGTCALLTRDQGLLERTWDTYCHLRNS